MIFLSCRYSFYWKNVLSSFGYKNVINIDLIIYVSVLVFVMMLFILIGWYCGCVDSICFDIVLLLIGIGGFCVCVVFWKDFWWGLVGVNWYGVCVFELNEGFNIEGNNKLLRCYVGLNSVKVLWNFIFFVIIIL